MADIVFRSCFGEKKIYGILTVGGDYQPGDQPPISYGDWHAWAEVQYKAGLRQKSCCMCSKLYFPQEMSGRVVTHTAKRRNGTTVKSGSPVCKECDAKAGG